MTGRDYDPTLSSIPRTHIGMRPGVRFECRAGEAPLNKSEELKADDEKDAKLTKSPRKVYKVKLAEGKTYQIDLKSKDFDAFLRVEDATGREVAFNDDARGGGTYDSRVIYKAAKSGEYSIIATSLDSKPGKFQLTLVVTDAASINSAFVGKAIPLVLKDGKARHEGELTADDLMIANKYYKVFTVPLDAGKSYRIDYRGGSPGFDAYLFLEDADGNKLAEDDDSGAKLDSQIKHQVKKAGTYRIITTTLPSRQLGKFTLEIVTIDGKGQKESRAPQYAPSAPRLSLPEDIPCSELPWRCYSVSPPALCLTFSPKTDQCGG